MSAVRLRVTAVELLYIQAYPPCIYKASALSNTRVAALYVQRYPVDMDDREHDGYAPIRAVRIDDELWESLGALEGRRRRSALIREFIRWYLRMPGGKLPRRPSAAVLTAPGDPE